MVVGRRYGNGDKGDGCTVNWENAKSWLIVAFLVLNMVLGWQLYQSRQEMLGYVEPYADLLANTKTLLAEHNFSLDTQVPQSHPDLPSLHATQVNLPLKDLANAVFPGAKRIHVDESLGLAITGQGRIKLNGDGSWQVTYQNPAGLTNQHIQDLLQNSWHGQNYEPDTATSQNGLLVYLQNYDNYPVFDAAILIQTTSDQILGYTQSGITNITPTGDAKPIISALDALDSLANSVDKSSQYADNRILKIDLGYARKSGSSPSSSSTSSSYWFPVWRVVTVNQLYYINALTGEVELAS